MSHSGLAFWLAAMSCSLLDLPEVDQNDIFEGHLAHLYVEEGPNVFLVA